MKAIAEPTMNYLLELFLVDLGKKAIVGDRMPGDS
jgi:hypothetical protein